MIIVIRILNPSPSICNRAWADIVTQMTLMISNTQTSVMLRHTPMLSSLSMPGMKLMEEVPGE